MKKMFLKKYWIVLISACCVGTGIALACSDGWGEEYGVSNFSPEIFVDSAYSPFFYSNQFYYGIGHEEQQDSRFNDANSREWSVFLNNQLRIDQLYYLLNKADAKAIDSAASVATKKETASGNQNLSAFYSYLQLAKTAETFALNNVTSSWDYEEKIKDRKKFDASALNQNLLGAFTKTTNPFLKERYWFQLVRSYFFNTSPQQAIDFFTTYEQKMPLGDIYFRTMAYAAGAYYKLKNYSKANYYYSRVYDGCNELKTAAHYSFHPQEETDWKATLALCRSNEEKITLWQMLGIFYADEQRAINAIYQLNAGSDKLDLLLARAINKYEQRFGSANSYSDVPVDTIAMKILPTLVTRIAAAGNTGQSWVWQMAAGYIKTLDAKYMEAGDWYAKASKSAPGTNVVRAQLRLLKMINTIAAAKRVDDKLEAQLLNDIAWLKDFDTKSMPQFRYHDAFDWLKIKMATRYKMQHDFVKAECFTSTTGFYASIQNVEAMKAFLSKAGKSAYEKLCASMSVKQLNDLFELQAIRLAYADSLDEAVEKMQQATASAETILPGNPFNARILDCHDCDHEAFQKIKYSKLSFLKKLVEIKSKIARGEDLYTNAVLLANAHYNITHFGNARAFYEGKVLGEGHSDPLYIDSSFRKTLTGTGMAIKYYMLALKNAATDEQKAKCQYLLSKCQRNEWYNRHVYNKSEITYGDHVLVNVKSLEGFAALKQYSNTQYYKEVLKECGYFKMYMATKK